MVVGVNEGKASQYRTGPGAADQVSGLKSRGRNQTLALEPSDSAIWT
jgi:hypothetical protein